LAIADSSGLGPNSKLMAARLPGHARSSCLTSVVAQICNRQASTSPATPDLTHALQDAILRNGRFQICATQTVHVGAAAPPPPNQVTALIQ
jgi:hypothetical protein